MSNKIVIDGNCAVFSTRQISPQDIKELRILSEAPLMGKQKSLCEISFGSKRDDDVRIVYKLNVSAITGTQLIGKYSVYLSTIALWAKSKMIPYVIFDNTVEVSKMFGSPGAIQKSDNVHKDIFDNMKDIFPGLWSDHDDCDDCDVNGSDLVAWLTDTIEEYGLNGK